MPAPIIAKDSKTLIFTAFFTFPPWNAHNYSNCFDSPFLPYFPLLSMELEVTARTTDAFALWKSPDQPQTNPA
jgi:hypothetical protein